MTRTTVTLDPDVATLLDQVMRERGLTFKEAVNSAIRAGLAPRAARADFSFPTYSMGEPAADLTHAGRLAADLEDQELARELGLGR
jgi:hypothetical protein